MPRPDRVLSPQPPKKPGAGHQGTWVLSPPHGGPQIPEGQDGMGVCEAAAPQVLQAGLQAPPGRRRTRRGSGETLRCRGANTRGPLASQRRSLGGRSPWQPEAPGTHCGTWVCRGPQAWEGLHAGHLAPLQMQMTAPRPPCGGDLPEVVSFCLNFKRHQGFRP